MLLKYRQLNQQVVWVLFYNSDIIQYMTLLITLISIIQSFSISLGVGSSTLAIINFFVAIADGTIDETERRMMGVVYVVLRVAMVAILLSSILLLAEEYLSTGNIELNGFNLGLITALAILFINAVLMTLRIMPSTFGPAIQAGSWYSLGTLSALQVLDLVNFSYVQFLFGYITWLFLSISIVNAIMAAMKSKRERKGV